MHDRRLISRLTEFDVVRLVEGKASQKLAQVVFGLTCAVAMILLRSLIDIVAPTSGPFAFVYPTVLLATLFGRWQAGLVAYLICFFWAWYFVLPTANSLYFEDPSDPARVVINAAAALIVLIFAEMFRHSGCVYARERDEEIERRQMLLSELDHRTKNNFALSVSLLELQQRGLENEESKAVLTQAIGRLHSFASAYTNLSDSHGKGAAVEMDSYLRDVVERFRKAALDDTIKVTVHVDPVEMDRETAVAIGLFTNEALTNCAKYAFADGEGGRIDVSLSQRPEGWSLIVSDTGRPSEAALAQAQSTGLGTRLFEAFARQAGASFDIDLTPQGCRVSLTQQQSETAA